MRPGLFIILLIGVSSGTDTSGYFTSNETDRTAVYSNDMQTDSYRSHAGISTHHDAFVFAPAPGIARGKIMQSRIFVVHNDRTFNLLGKRQNPVEHNRIQQPRGWREQVIDLFR